MRQVRWASWLGAVAVTLMVAAQPAAADVASDRAAAIVVYPYVWVDGTAVDDTLIQLSNTSDEPVLAHCFYENANWHCAGDGSVCYPGDSGNSPECGLCLPGWNETDFRVRLTPLQPLAWLASEGESRFPLDGRTRTGIGGSSNAGSRIPPVPEDPFIGVLKCITVDDTGVPSDRNVLKGESTTVYDRAGDIDVEKGNAVGIQAIEGAVNDDRVLVLGGPEPEYNGCPNVLIMNHLFDFVNHPGVPGDGETITYLTLTPCTQDLLRQIPSAAVVQYLVFNEFEQRFSTSRIVDCYQDLQISLIDTNQPERSIFSAGVAGTVAGQTRLTPIGSGLVGTTTVEVDNEYFTRTAQSNLHYQGQREDADLITLP